MVPPTPDRISVPGILGAIFRECNDLGLCWSVSNFLNSMLIFFATKFASAFISYNPGGSEQPTGTPALEIFIGLVIPILLIIFNRSWIIQSLLSPYDF